MNKLFVEIHSLDKSLLCTSSILSVKLNGSLAIEIVSQKAIRRQNDNTSIVFVWRVRSILNWNRPLNIQCLPRIDPGLWVEVILQDSISILAIVDCLYSATPAYQTLLISTQKFQSKFNVGCNLIRLWKAIILKDLNY